MENKTTHLQIRVPQELKHKIKTLADKKYVDMSTLVKLWIAEKLEALEAEENKLQKK